jgi:hypothetical protein
LKCRSRALRVFIIVCKQSFQTFTAAVGASPKSCRIKTAGGIAKGDFAGLTTFDIS